jgi:uncharacterized repeat protein (TIGR01451 family)
MKNFFFCIFFSFVTATSILAQSADPAVTGANFVASTTAVGQNSTLTISFANTGSTAIPTGSIELTISTAKNYYTSNGVTPPAGTGGALFNWVYIGVDSWRGTNKEIIPAFGGGDITLQVTGKSPSSAFEITNINVQPINSFGSFNDSPNNNNLQPKLKINPATALIADLSITKKLVGSKIRQLNDTLTYQIVLKNEGNTTATNCVIKDSTTAGLQLLSGSPTKGTFSNSLWNIPALNAGDSAILVIKAKAIRRGISFNYALIKSTDDNTLNNEAEACVSIPFQLCTGEKVEASLPTFYTNVIWYKGGTQIGTGNTILLSDIGNYTFTAINVNCPAEGCCPIVIEAAANCCAKPVCIPITVRKMN